MYKIFFIGETLNRGERMKKKKLVLKPFVVPMLYGVFAVIVVVSLFLSIEVVKDKTDLTYVNKSILDDYVPVVNTEAKVTRPYTSDKVSISNSYYDYNGNDEDQTNSIIVHENMYIQNTGINYKSDEAFDIVSMLDGEVIDVSKKELLGDTITIKHANDVISSYQCVKDVTVKKGDKVTLGQKLATSGSCDLIKDSTNNLHFELYINGSIVNPDLYYDKIINNQTNKTDEE